MLYDSVPGGTGYLHQLLANEAKTLVEVFRLGTDPFGRLFLQCRSGERRLLPMRLPISPGSGDGACVARSGQSDFGSSWSRNLDQLERVASIADIYINPNFDSELEARFIESLRRLSGQGGLAVRQAGAGYCSGKVWIFA